MNTINRFNDFPLSSHIRTNSSGDFSESWSWLESEFELGAIASGQWVLKARADKDAPALLSGEVTLLGNGVINTLTITNGGEAIPPGVQFYQVRMVYANGFVDVWFQGKFQSQKGLL